jgi:hypothetical protein
MSNGLPIGDQSPPPEERREPPPSEQPEGEPPPPHEPDDPQPNEVPTIGDPFSSPTTIGDPPGGSGGMQFESWHVCKFAGSHVEGCWLHTS